MDRVIPVVGTLFAKDEATLSAEVEGKVERTRAEFGDRIEEGQELAQIDTSAYDALVRQQEANLAKVTAQAANAASSLHRVQALSKDQVAAASDLDQAQASHDQARAEVKAAEATLAIARLNLEKSRLKAPFDAAVSERIASAGDYVKIGSPLFRVVNDRRLKLVAQAPERYASLVAKEQLLSFTVDAFPGERFSGKVFLVSPSVNTASRAFQFGALVENGDRRLKANTFARGELLLEKGVPTTMVPLEAVLQSSGSSRVFLLDGLAARSRTVQVGRIERGMQEILSGVRPGDKVITSGHYRLVDGARVHVRAETPRPAATAKDPAS
mgnify:FL=1